VDIFAQVKALKLPDWQYVVFGAGPLAAHGIRETNDVDLFVTTALYRRLKASGWSEKCTSTGGLYLASGIYEADDTWEYGEYNPAIEELIGEADVIQGVPFAPLTEVLRWKRAFDRPKNIQDLRLIEEHLRARH
jgi:hypothetical protein